jgi:hypothetical protein
VIRVCESGYKDCDKMVSNGCEIDIMTNNKHCGACGKPCAVGLTCTEGVCQ